MSQSSFVEIRLAQKSYGPLEGLKDISFYVGKGQIVAIIGPLARGSQRCCGQSTNSINSATERSSWMASRRTKPCRIANKRRIPTTCGRKSAWCSSIFTCSCI